MAVKKKEEILEQVKNLLGENDSDEAIQLIEDITDTITPTDDTDWKAKYEENDKEWRTRYRDRFFGKGNDDKDDLDDDEDDDEDDDKEITNFDELFKEE